MQRRHFIKNGAIALASFGLVPRFLQRSVFPSSHSQRADAPILVAIFMRGGADGLNVLVPYGDSNYQKLRPTIGIPEPGKAAGALDLDGFFGLHPRLPSMAKYYQQGILAPIHACGSSNGTRSHFDAMDFMEAGSPDNKLADGWLNRHLQEAGLSGEVFRAVAMGGALPRSLSGSAEAIALANLEVLQLAKSKKSNTHLDAIWEMNVRRGDFIGEVALSGLDAIELGRNELDPSKYNPANGAQYPTDPFGQSLRAIAQMIKANVGLEVATTDIDGWDTHTNQGDGNTGALAGALQNLDDGIKSFVTDLGDQMERVVVLTMTEFGRTAAQNGSGGTDHGHATAMFALGGGVRGGKVFGKWPGLAANKLYEGRDLAMTTDFRKFFGEILENHLGNRNIASVFPNYDYGAESPLGIL